MTAAFPLHCIIPMQVPHGSMRFQKGAMPAFLALAISAVFWTPQATAATGLCWIDVAGPSGGWKPCSVKVAGSGNSSSSSSAAAINRANEQMYQSMKSNERSQYQRQRAQSQQDSLALEQEQQQRLQQENQQLQQANGQWQRRQNPQAPQAPACPASIMAAGEPFDLAGAIAQAGSPQALLARTEQALREMSADCATFDNAQVCRVTKAVTRDVNAALKACTAARSTTGSVDTAGNPQTQPISQAPASGVSSGGNPSPAPVVKPPDATQGCPYLIHTQYGLTHPHGDRYCHAGKLLTCDIQGKNSAGSFIYGWSESPGIKGCDALAPSPAAKENNSRSLKSIKVYEDD